MTHFTFTVSFQRHEAIMKNMKLLLFLLVDKKSNDLSNGGLQFPFTESQFDLDALPYTAQLQKHYTLKLICLDSLFIFHLCVMHRASLMHANRTNALLHLLHASFAL